MFESVDREVPLAGLHWFIDHAETISPRIERIRALGAASRIQHRMAFQGEHFIARYGAAKAAESPPIKLMLAAGVPVGAGTDATRVASYNPFVSLYWLVAGRTVGGTSRTKTEWTVLEALRRWTVGSSGSRAKRGRRALTPARRPRGAVG